MISLKIHLENTWGYIWMLFRDYSSAFKNAPPIQIMSEALLPRTHQALQLGLALSDQQPKGVQDGQPSTKAGVFNWFCPRDHHSTALLHLPLTRMHRGKLLAVSSPKLVSRFPSSPLYYFKTYFSYFRYLSRCSRVIWKCVEISKWISRTPCNTVADHQGAADPRLKTPELKHQWESRHHKNLLTPNPTLKTIKGLICTSI